MSFRIQCIILIKSAPKTVYTGSEDGSTLEGYTLVSSAVREHFPLSLINPSIPIVTPEQVVPTPNEKFDLIEVWQDHTGIKDLETAKKRKLKLYVDVYNLDVVRSLFPTTANIQFITKFRINEKCVMYQRLTALTEENLSVFQKLLESGATFRWRRPEGGTTLAHFATEKGCASLIALLGQFQPNLGADQTENTPLHTAVKKKDITMVKALLENGADIDGRAPDGSTALHLAVKAGLPEMVRLLAEKGASIDAKTTKGWTSLHLAADANNLQIVALLLQNSADIESRIEAGTDKGLTPLHAAIKKSRWEVAKQLVEKGASLTAECVQGRNALYFAVDAGNMNFIKYLIDRHIDITSLGNRKAFYLAFRKEYSFVLKNMMELGFSVEGSDMADPDVLFGAIHKNLFELVEKLLENGVDVHQKHLFLNVKTTPIHVACRHADEKMVQLLLDHGADPAAFRGSSRLNTPIAEAVESGNKEVVKLLLSKNISVRDRHEFLLSATEHRRHGLMKLLLENGAAVNQSGLYNFESNNALFFAARCSDQEAVDILMKYGAIFDFKYVSIDVKCRGGFATPAFLEAFLAHGFTVDLDTDAATHLLKLLTECEVDCDEDSVDDHEWYYFLHKKDCAKAVAQFIVKMEAAGMKIAGGVGSVVPPNVYEAFKLDEVRKECDEEVSLMKSRYVAQTGVTFFAVLTKTSNQVARYTRNEAIRSELNELVLGPEHKHYGSILKCQFQRGNWRRALLDKGMKVLGLLNWRFRGLPFDLKEDIVSFLNNQDLMTLQKCIPTVES